MMSRIMAFIVVVVCMAQVVLLRAQEPSLDLADKRFTYHRIDDGYLRLDLRSGEVATCRQREAGWTCTMAPEERAALENEIARLQRENGTLKKAMLAHNLPLPGGVASAPSAEQQRELNLKVPLPSDAEIDRVMSAFEKMWRRLVDIVQKSPNIDRI